MTNILEMKYPHYFKNELLTFNLNSNVAIATLWTRKEVVEKGLEEETLKKVAIVGQLYSSFGINYILRNVALYPIVDTIILCGNDRTLSGKDLLEVSLKDDFLQKELKNFVPDFLEHIKIIDLRGSEIDFLQLTGEIERNFKSKIKLWGKGQVFKETKEEVNFYPSEGLSFVCRKQRVFDTWVKSLEHIMRFGFLKTTQYSSSRELINLIHVFDEEPNSYDFSKFPKEVVTSSILEKYIPQILSDITIKGVEYTYGQRLFNLKGFNQINNIIDKLKENKEGRRNVATTWDIEKDATSENPPCLSFITFLVQDEQLVGTFFMRSNDLFRAFPQNAMAFRRLQQYIAEEVGVSLGKTCVISNSAHVYQENFNDVLDLLKEHGYRGNWIPFTKNTCVWTQENEDPRGYIVISIDKEKQLIQA
ncbi:thymidylate synthase, partial [Anaerovirgula multivorans]